MRYGARDHAAGIRLACPAGAGSRGLGFSGSFNYDRRGNLLSIGSAGSGRAFAYDHENQCVTAGGFNAYNKSDFVYDGKGRLRKRTDYSWNGSSWTPTGETRYVYDGMLLIQERTSAGHPAVTYTRGLDLSGSLAGAGGIGGLLARTVHQSTSPYQPSTSAFYHADGNGNVTYLLNQDRSHGASYKYDPYGRLIASSGGLAAGNLMRFSSKPWHDHSETYHYGYRFYLPEGQRWLNRDPIEEDGGMNLYRFCGSRPTHVVDPLGLSWVDFVPLLGTAKNCIPIFRPPGTRPGDYGSIPTPSCEECRTDPEYAEQKCLDAMRRLMYQNMRSFGAPSLGRTVVEVIVGGGFLASPTGVGQIVGGTLILDGGINFVCTMKHLYDMYDAAKFARDNWCKCPSK